MQKITLTHRRSEIFIVRGRLSNQTDCKMCGCKSIALTIDEAVLASQFSTREIIRFIENDEIHTNETDDRRLTICLTSLERRI